MSYSIQYKELFRVKIFHRFFLDKGTDDFKSMNDADQQKQLKDYDFRSFLKVGPTAETRQRLNGYNLVFKQISTGFTVWSKVNENDDTLPFVPLADDLEFTFLLQVNDARFYNYTNLKMENAGKLYYLSNRQLDTEPNNFPLIDKAAGNFHVDEDFILSDDGESGELQQLQPGEKMNLLGLVRIFMKGDNSSLNVTNAQDEIQEPAPAFEVVFKNRSTVWRYLFNADQQVTGGDDVKKENGNSKILITKTEHPLTQTGFISVELGGVELPNPSVALVRPDASDNKIYSEIYM
jgi:hypothetical protein